MDKREEYERRARECLQAMHGLMTEARREGYVVEAYSHYDINGLPVSRVTVTLR